jgi:hypothetical protein
LDHPSTGHIRNIFITITVRLGEGLLSPNQTRHPAQFPLRLAKSLREAANSIAKEQGVSLNHFIAIAVAEKISRTESQFESSPDGHQSRRAIDFDAEGAASGQIASKKVSGT